jgi:hypothetical protein
MSNRCSDTLGKTFGKQKLFLKPGVRIAVKMTGIIKTVYESRKKYHS